MTKFLLPLFIVAATSAAFGQANTKHNIGTLVAGHNGTFLGAKPSSQAAAKSTTLSDTMYYYNNTPGQLIDSSVALQYTGLTPNDTGYLFGTNSYGDSAFAERFDYTWGQDTLINVIGVVSYWAGVVAPSSAHALTIHMWGLDPAYYQLDTNIYAWNFPGASLAAKSIPLTDLNLVANQPTTTFFDAPVNMNNSFYIGYSFGYKPDSLMGDTISLRSTPNGKGMGTGQYQLITNNNSVDTYLYTRNAVMETDGYWYDVYNDYNYNVNLSLVPIFRLNITTGLNGPAKNGLKLLGNSPNPATNSTDINFALASATDVTIQVTDINGRVLNTLSQPMLTPGDHSVSIPLTEYPAGNYVYILHTGNGATMAAMFSVIK